MERYPRMEELQHPNFLKLKGAIGTIQAGPNQLARLDEITERLRAGEFFVPVTGRIPSKCIDGRPGAIGLAPNSAGGSESLMVADDLTFKRFAGGTTLESYSKVLTMLQRTGQPIGGHTAAGAMEPSSGCGANDKLPAVYEFIAKHDDVIRNAASRIGVEADDALHRLIVENASARSEFSLGSELLTVLQTAGGPEVIDVLEGPHQEVITVINKRAGTTLDRTLFSAVFGPEYQVFNVDAWSFGAAASLLAEDESQIPALTVAQAYDNLGVAFVLCGEEMRVTVLE